MFKFGLKGRSARRRWLSLAVAASLAGVLVFAISAALGTSVTGSQFEIDDNANLVVDDPANNIDWLAGGTGTALRDGVRATADTPSGKGDSALGQGSSEDQAVPTFKPGSIPPNKSDLKYFGVFQERNANGSFLHLFWTRVQNPSGTTNMDFEFNQSQTMSSNGHTPVRTKDDVLIEYHLDNGGTVATLSKRMWNGSSWGAEETLTPTGSINTTSIAAADSGGLGSLSPRTFGEASVDLSLVLPADSCVSLGSAYLKSRSSDSFSAEIKDIIEPEKVSVTNCGSVLVMKEAEGTMIGLTEAKFSVMKGSTDADGNEADKTTLADHGDGLYCADNLKFGDHTVTEEAPPPGYDLPAETQQVFKVTDNGTCADRFLKPGGPTPDLVFVDPAKQGAIKITKTAKDKSATGGSSPLAGATFTVDGQNPQTTDEFGHACFEGLAFGKHTVHETSAPTGYDAADDKEITVETEADCDTGVAATASFVDTPLSKITVGFESLAGPGKTEATIKCTDDNGDPIALPEDPAWALDGLKPGTYSCTVEVDP